MGMKLYVVLLQEWERERESHSGFLNRIQKPESIWRPVLHAHITQALLNKSSPLDKASFSSVLQSSLFVRTVYQTLHLFLSAAKHTPRTEQFMEFFCKMPVLPVCLCLLTFSRWPAFCERAIWFPNNGNSITKWRSFNCFRAPIPQPPLSRSLSPFLFLSLSFSESAIVEVMGESEKAWKANWELGIYH